MLYFKNDKIKNIIFVKKYIFINELDNKIVQKMEKIKKMRNYY